MVRRHPTYRAVGRGGDVAPDLVPLVIERNVLERRFDLRVMGMCQEGYPSSLALMPCAHSGLARATDLVGGLRRGADTACRSRARSSWCGREAMLPPLG